MSWSKVSLLACIFFIFCTGFLYYPKWKQSGTEATLSWDASGYYMYLPAIFIYHDLKKCTVRKDILQQYGPTPDFQQAFKHESGNYVMKYSIGQAIQFLPAFLISHSYALISKKYPPDGFSTPYQLGISLHAFLVAVIGLIFLRKLLLKYFNETSVAITLVAIVFGSNYLDYSAINGAMTHNGLFTIYALLLYATHKYHESPSKTWASCIGILIGLAALTRPTEIVCGLIPLFWGMNSGGLKKRMMFFKSNYIHITLAGLFVILIGSIQLMYWKYVSGEWIVYSYEEQGFSWLKPHLWEGIFSYKSGWLTYSPIFILLIPGLYALRQMYPNIMISTSVFLLIFIYITFAWDIWWYGGSLGQRAMVQAYPIMALPISAAIEISLRKKSLYLLLGGFIFTCIVYNLWLTHHAHRGGLFHAGQMTKAYFWKVLGKNEKKEEYLKLLDTDEEYDFDMGPAQRIYHNDFEQEPISTGCSTPINGNRSICLNKERQFSPEYVIDVSPHKGKWIHTSSTFHCVNKEWTNWQMAQYVIKFFKGDEEIKYRMIRVHRLLHDGETQTIGFESEVPEDADQLKIYFWNAGSNKTIVIDDLKVYLIN